MKRDWYVNGVSAKRLLNCLRRKARGAILRWMLWRAWHSGSLWWCVLSCTNTDKVRHEKWKPYSAWHIRLLQFSNSIYLSQRLKVPMRFEGGLCNCPISVMGMSCKISRFCTFQNWHRCVTLCLSFVRGRPEKPLCLGWLIDINCQDIFDCRLVEVFGFCSCSI